MNGPRDVKRRNATERAFQQVQFDGVILTGDRARAEAEYRQRKGDNTAQFKPGDLVRILGTGETYDVIGVEQATAEDWPKYLLKSPHRQTFLEHELEAAPRDTAALVRFSAARQALAEARTIDEVKDIRDKAEALRLYTKQAGESLQMQNDIAEIKLRAERRAGELLHEMPKNAGTRGQLQGRDSSGAPTVGGPEKRSATLSELGISYNQSSRWQAMAEVPETEFEAHIAATKAAGRELTSTGVQKLAKKRKRVQDPAPSPQAIPQIDDLTSLPDDHAAILIAESPTDYHTLGQEATRVLQPGGSLLVKVTQEQLPRTLMTLFPYLAYHRLVCLTGKKSWTPVLWFSKGDYTGSTIDTADRIAWLVKTIQPNTPIYQIKGEHHA